MIHVLVVDDHAVVREGLKRVLSDAGDITVKREARSSAEALELVRDESFDVVVTDISMPGRGGLELLTDLRAEFPLLPVLVLSVHGEDQFAVRALKNGASGYLTKESAPEELVRAVRRVHEGGRYVSAGVAERLAIRLQPRRPTTARELLSEREFQIMERIGRGQNVTQIAGHLGLSVKTVSTYRARLLEKMQLQSNAEIIAYVVRNQLVGG